MAMTASFTLNAPRAQLTSRRTNAPQQRIPQIRPGRPKHSVSTFASKADFDFDAALATMADKFEKSDNKPAIIGWSVAGLSVFFFSEWLIHLPGLNVLLGFPIQLVGLITLPYLMLRYYVDKDGDVSKDVGEVVGKVTSKLPGLEKK